MLMVHRLLFYRAAAHIRAHIVTYDSCKQVIVWCVKPFSNSCFVNHATVLKAFSYWCYFVSFFAFISFIFLLLVVSDCISKMCHCCTFHRKLYWMYTVHHSKNMHAILESSSKTEMVFDQMPNACKKKNVIQTQFCWT